VKADKCKFIAVHGTKGGGGKSMVALNLGNYKAREGKRVLIIETDVGGPTLDEALGAVPAAYYNDFYKGRCLKDLIYDNPAIPFDMIFARKEELPSERQVLVKHLQHFQQQKRWLDANYDYVIFDCRPGFFPELVNTLVIADIVIEVSRVDIANINPIKRTHEWIKKLFTNQRIIHVINQEPGSLSDHGLILNEEELVVVRKAFEKWKKFLTGKEKVFIPLDTSVACYLRWKKIFSPDHYFVTEHMRKLAEMIDEEEIEIVTNLSALTRKMKRKAMSKPIMHRN